MEKTLFANQHYPSTAKPYSEAVDIPTALAPGQSLSWLLRNLRLFALLECLFITNSSVPALQALFRVECSNGYNP